MKGWPISAATTMLIGPEQRHLVFCIPLGTKGPPTTRTGPRERVGSPPQVRLPGVRMLAVTVHGVTVCDTEGMPVARRSPERPIGGKHLQAFAAQRAAPCVSARVLWCLRSYLTA